jgi:hypothetical protein
MSSGGAYSVPWCSHPPSLFDGVRTPLGSNAKCFPNEMALSQQQRTCERSIDRFRFPGIIGVFANTLEHLCALDSTGQLRRFAKTRPCWCNYLTSPTISWTGLKFSAHAGFRLTRTRPELILAGPRVAIVAKLVVVGIIFVADYYRWRHNNHGFRDYWRNCLWLLKNSLSLRNN